MLKQLFIKQTYGKLQTVRKFIQYEQQPGAFGGRSRDTRQGEYIIHYSP